MSEHEHDFTVLTGHENDEPEVIACTECSRQWTVSPREDSSGPAFAVNYHECVVSYDPEAGAAYVAVQPHDRVARTASVHPHDNVMLDYDEEGRLLGVEVVGIVRDESSAEDRYVTKTGKVLTDADIEALADEAERGYDVSHFSRRDIRVGQLRASVGRVLRHHNVPNERIVLSDLMRAIPVSLDHDTGEWAIAPRTPEEWAEWGRWDKAPATEELDDDTSGVVVAGVRDHREPGVRSHGPTVVGDDGTTARTQQSFCPACNAELIVWAWRDELGTAVEPVERPGLMLVRDESSAGGASNPDEGEGGDQDPLGRGDGDGGESVSRQSTSSAGNAPSHVHDFTALTSPTDEPEVIACTECGRQWTVTPRVWVDEHLAGDADDA